MYREFKGPANHSSTDETRKRTVVTPDRRGLVPGFMSTSCKKDIHGEKCLIARCSCHCHNSYSGRKGEK